MAREEHKLRLATCSLAGCFGCHMSFLDIDEWLFELDKFFTFDRSPFTDIKTLENADVGLIEGGLCNQENIEVLLDFRKNCKLLVSVGACAINGGVPALRNGFPVEDCLLEVYQNGVGLQGTVIPSGKELPSLLPKVLPVHELVKVDYFLPGCPPPAEAFIELLCAIRDNRAPEIAYEHRRFD